MNSYPESDEDEIQNWDEKENVNRPLKEGAESVGTIPKPHHLQKEEQLKSQGEQELIVSILERKDGHAHIQSIAKEMGVAPHKLTIPLQRLTQKGTITVTGSGIRLSVSLTRESSEE